MAIFFYFCNILIYFLLFFRLEVLPAEIGLLHNLTELNVASNRLRYLPSTVDLSLLKSYNGKKACS